MFAQGLFWLAPFVAVGSIQAFSWLGRSTSMRVALGVAVIFFLFGTTVTSPVFGGEPPTIASHNSGQAYDKIYVVPQEVSAIRWLQRRVRDESDFTVQAEVSSGIYSYSDLRPVSHESPSGQADIFTALIRRDGYVFLGDSATQEHEVTIFYEGDIVTYHYPIDFLDNNKDLVYSSDGARVYR